MSKGPLSERCSVMMNPERPLPSDCPKDALYIKTTDSDGAYDLHPITPFPIVVEGGSGNDEVTVIGPAKNPVLIDGGKGNDKVTVQGEGGSPARGGKGGLVMGPSDQRGSQNQIVHKDGPSPAVPLTPMGITFLGALLIAFATVGAIAWRALKADGVERYR
jgi:hypothetical protein